MRPTRILQYVAPDDWKDEEVEADYYLIGRDGAISYMRMVGIELDGLWKDMNGPKRVRGIYAERMSGRRLYFPEDDLGRSVVLPPSPRHVILHRHPLTPIEELTTPWISVYGHAPGEGNGMGFCLIPPLKVRPDDVRCVLGRFEAYRAERILDFLEPGAPPGVRTYVRWLGKAGRVPQQYHQSPLCDDEIRAAWFTYGAPAVLWCCSPAEADALWRAMATMLSDELVTAISKDKSPADKRGRHDPRNVLMEHLEAVTQVGDPGRYLAAAAARAIMHDSWIGFHSALARKSYSLTYGAHAPIAKLAEELGLTEEDLRKLAEAERTLGLA